MMRRATLFVLCLLGAASSFAQSPNTSTIIVVAVDASGAVVRDAAVSVVNAQTGTRREAITGSDGFATIAALPLTGTYTISVTKSGFAADEVRGVVLRAGDTARVRVRLNVAAADSQVTV